MAGGTMGVVARGVGRLFGAGTLTGLSEGQLLDRFVRSGDEAAFEALVDRHGPMVRGVCRQLLRDPNDVDDAVQATFFVLVRKAGSLRRRDLLGNWLYGVAYRVAVRSRSVTARRRSLEVPTGDDRPEAEAPVSDSPRDGLAEVHEELSRLPEKYRSPVLLCDLEGRTHAEAAALLGWPTGTVKGRLSRARALLKTRLTRRGLTLSAAAAAVEALGRHPTAAAAASSALTLRALAFASAGSASITAAGRLTGPAADLAQGVLHAMTLAKLSTALGSLALVGSLMTGAGVLAYQGPAFPNAGRSVPKPAAAESMPARAGTYDLVPDAADPANAKVGDATHVLFDKMLASKEKWTPHTLDRVFHWSRAVKEAQGYLSDSPANFTAARQAHADRMRRLHEMTQRLSGPDQAELADTARVARHAAEREVTGDTSKPQGPAASQPTKPATAAAKPTPASPDQPPASSPQITGGGGFDGGGADDSEFVDRQARGRIAEIMPKVVSFDKAPKTKAILQKLDEPIAMNFPNETPLEDVLKYIKQASQGNNDPGFPIYVDPRGLKDADKTMHSVVALDLEGVPVKTTLRLLLKQVGLAYCLKDGLLFISTPQGVLDELVEFEKANVPADQWSQPTPGMGMGMGGGMGGGFR